MDRIPGEQLLDNIRKAAIISQKYDDINNMNSKNAENIRLTGRFSGIVQDGLDQLPAFTNNIGTLYRFEVQNRENSQTGCYAGEKVEQKLFARTKDWRPPKELGEISRKVVDAAAATIKKRSSKNNLPGFW